MTKFTTLKETKKEGKKTVFTHCVGSDMIIYETSLNQPKDWDNVLHIGHDESYGDVFKVSSNYFTNNFSIYFGIKGDEFD